MAISLFTMLTEATAHSSGSQSCLHGEVNGCTVLIKALCDRTQPRSGLQLSTVWATLMKALTNIQMIATVLLRVLLMVSTVPLETEPPCSNLIALIRRLHHHLWWPLRLSQRSKLGLPILTSHRGLV